MSHSATIESVAREFLGRLQNVKAIGPGEYKGCCPGHDDHTPSLKITETPDRLLIHCWAGCRACDVLAVMGLRFTDLFVPNEHTHSANPPRTKRHQQTSKTRQPEPRPFHRWDWRKTCAELERVIWAVRERPERVLEATRGLDMANVSNPDLDEIWAHLGPAFLLLEKCEELDDLLFLIQQRLRQEEQEHEQTFRRKMRRAS